MEALRFDRIVGTPPAPLSDDERARRVVMFADFRQNARLTADPATCGLNLLYDIGRRMREADLWQAKSDAEASLLELDDRLTGKDFLLEAMVHDLRGARDARTREQIEDMLKWHHYPAEQREPRLDQIVAIHGAMASVRPREAA